MPEVLINNSCIFQLELQTGHGKLAKKSSDLSPLSLCFPARDRPAPSSFG